MGHAVKDGRRRKIAIKHARKKVTREQQVMFYAVISTMPFCVPRKVYDGSSTFSVVHCGGDVEFTDGEVEHGD